MKRLDEDFYSQDVLLVAPMLLGAFICVDNGYSINRLRIVEVEAYRGEEDLACHASKGRTKRTEIMYHKGGKVYVYLIYGVHWMFNVVAGKENDPQAVLIRGVEECVGPGRVGRLLGVNKKHYGIDLSISNNIWIERGSGVNEHLIKRTTRIGIDYAGEEWKNKKWRYLIS